MCRIHQVGLLAGIAMAAISARAENPMIVGQSLQTVESYYQPAPSVDEPSPSDIVNVPVAEEDEFLEEYYFDPTWRFTIEGLFLQRTAGSALNLGETRTNPGGVLVDTLSVTNPAFKFQPGLRLQLARQLDDGGSWEGIYFGMQNWQQRRSIAADPLGATTLATSPQLQTDDLIGGFDTGINYIYGSRVHNVEINRRLLWNEGPRGNFSTLVGFRYLNWRESFRMSGSDVFTGTFENLDIRTRNQLLGLQIGGRLTRDWENFNLAGELKAGLYGNAASQVRSNADSSGIGGNPPGFVPISDTHNAGGLASIVDGSLVGRYWLTPQLSFRGGYQMFFVPGLALAPNQAAGFNTSGFVFLHGPSVGFDWAW